MDHVQPKPPVFWRSSTGLASLVAAGVGAFYLLAEHRAHVFGALPYLLLLACPLMHVFMHRGHHNGHGHRPPRSSDDEQRQ